MAGWTLDELVRRYGLRTPTKPALISGERSLTWKELDHRVDRVAGALSGRGLAPGDRVAILMANCPDYIELYFGLARAGMIAVPVNYRLMPHEMAAILNQVEPRLVVAAADYGDQVGGVLPLLDKTPALWAVGDDLPGSESYEALIAAAPQTPTQSPVEDADVFAIFFTSGTTGLPKGAMVSHRNLIANGFNQMIADGSRADDINLMATPLYHMGAVFVGVTYMMLGCTQVILPRFAPDAWLNAVRRHHASVSLLVPTMLNSVLNAPEFAAADLSSLRLIFYGGGPMPPAVLRRALADLPCGFTQGYGLTETLEATFLVAADHVLGGSEAQTRRLASAGREAVEAEVRIVDDDGRDVAAGVVGEVLVRSRSVISGYWNRPDATAQAIRDGWFHTGDLGYLDDDRYLFIVDRKTDMVVSGGVNIYTKEIEAVLYSHPAVREAAVFGLPDQTWGEAVSAAVVLHPGACVSQADLIAHCKDRLAGYKKPRRLWFLDDLPKNPSGKVLKRELRQSLGGTDR